MYCTAAMVTVNQVLLSEYPHRAGRQIFLQTGAIDYYPNGAKYVIITVV